MNEIADIWEHSVWTNKISNPFLSIDYSTLSKIKYFLQSEYNRNIFSFYFDILYFHCKSQEIASIWVHNKVIPPQDRSIIASLNQLKLLCSPLNCTQLALFPSRVNPIFNCERRAAAYFIAGSFSYVLLAILRPLILIYNRGVKAIFVLFLGYTPSPKIGWLWKLDRVYTDRFYRAANGACISGLRTPTIQFRDSVEVYWVCLNLVLFCYFHYCLLFREFLEKCTIKNTLNYLLHSFEDCDCGIAIPLYFS